MFEGLLDFAKRMGTELSRIYFDEDGVWGSDKEWKEFLDSGRRPGDGMLPPAPPPPRPVYLPSTRNHGKRSSGTGGLVLVGASSEVSGAGHLPAGRPDYLKRGLFGTLFGPPVRPVSGGTAPGNQHDRAWLSGGRDHGRRK